jgi:predicted DNA-binding antitoxin AbrB/MazE fold protein
MIQQIRAVFEKGLLRPLEELRLEENAEVRVTVESSGENESAPQTEDPFDCIRFDGPPDLAERFDDYRFGRVDS